MTDPIVQARGVEKAYRSDGRTVPVLESANLDVDPGEFVAVVGPSGCGKTTLLNCLSGLDTVDEGTVRVDGQDLTNLSDRARTRHRAERMGFVFQSFNLVPVLTAERNVAMPLMFAGTGRREAMDRARAVLGEVGLADRVDHRPPQLSGGQQQRVAIARALVNEPSIVWADEPTGNLDRTTGQAIIDLFVALNREQAVTLVVVTHDPAVAEAADSVLQMENGRIGSAGTADDRQRTFRVVHP